MAHLAESLPRNQIATRCTTLVRILCSNVRNQNALSNTTQSFFSLTLCPAARARISLSKASHDAAFYERADIVGWISSYIVIKLCPLMHEQKDIIRKN
jgi:hypothetical protein